MRTLLLTFIFAAFGSLCAQADPKPPDDPCDTARKFCKLIAEYARTKEAKLLDAVDAMAAPITVPNKPGSFSELLTGEKAEDILDGMAKSWIHDRKWVDGNVAVAVGIVMADHGFVQVDPLLLIRNTDGGSWLVVNALTEDGFRRSNANDEIKRKCIALLDKFKEAKPGIKAPIFEMAQEERRRIRDQERRREMGMDDDGEEEEAAEGDDD